MAKKKNKNIIKIIILIILIIAVIFLGNTIIRRLEEAKFEKILKENDSTNYELTETVNGEETKVLVRGKILLSSNENSKVWVNETEKKRYVIDDEYKTAILDQNDDNLKVNSLNYSYINDFFENSNQVFKYLGKENGFFKLQFKENGSKKITVFYLNEKTNTIEKMVQNSGKFEFISEFKVVRNKVSKEDVALPNLEGYRAYDSATSTPDEEFED